MIKLRYIPILILTLIGGFVQGQDAHFSQYYLAQQELNPALNGLFQGQYRAGVQYRDQSSNIVGVESYRTSYAMFDSKIHIKNNDPSKP